MDLIHHSKKRKCSVALVIIYNENFEQNIPIINKIYKDRFSYIYHLMPNYQGNQKNVVKVKGVKHFFQGYIAQGLATFYKDEFEDYLFIADDLIINPQINQNNYREYFEIKQNQGFIKNLVEINPPEQLKGHIFWTFNWCLLPYVSKTKILQKYMGNELPSYDEAISYFKEKKLDIDIFKQNAKHGVFLKYALNHIYTPVYKELLAYYIKKLNKVIPLEFIFNKIFLWQPDYNTFFKVENIFRRLVKDIILLPKYMRDIVKKWFYYLNYSNNKMKIAYPMISGYSDIIVIPKSKIQKFCVYCQCFAEAELYAEIAIPTAIFLMKMDIKTVNNINKQALDIWPWDHTNIICDSGVPLYEYLADSHNSLAKLMLLKEKLLKQFPNYILYAHPIKLSNWELSKI